MYNSILLLVDALLTVLSVYVAFFVSATYGEIPFDGSVNSTFLSCSLIAVLANNYFMGRRGLYSKKRRKFPILLFEVFKASLLTSLILYAICSFAGVAKLSKTFVTAFFVSLFVSMSVLRGLFFLYLYYVRRSNKASHNILVVGDADRVRNVTEVIEKHSDLGVKVLGYLKSSPENGAGTPILGNIEELPEILKRETVDEVVFATRGDRSIDLPKYLEVCKKMGVPCRVLPAMWKPGTASLRAENIEEVPFLVIRFGSIDPVGMFYKRVLDIVVGTAGFLVFLAMYPFVAIAIKLDSPGPVLFKQKRVGKRGRIFTLYKFRTMYVDAEERKKELMEKNIMKGPIFKVKDDPRVTRVGRFLRRNSLDEFPQFINVLKGDMSVVGPRPPTPDEVEKYELWHYKRLSIKPGITGLWQVSGRNEISDFSEIVELDCKYLENWSIWLDIKIILKTILVVLQRRGAH